MESVAQDFFRFFRGGSAAEPEVHSGKRTQEHVSRRSTGFSEFLRAISREPGLSILDLGPTSPRNIEYMIGIGHKVYNEDILRASQDPALALKTEDGNLALDATRFLSENLLYKQPTFDAVMFWDVADYLHESLVKPVVGRICSAMKPGGILLGFFHTKDAGGDSPHYRYHIVSTDTLDLQPLTPPAKPATYNSFKLQRVFNNRHIENLFHDYASIKFFLGRDNIREVLVIR